MQGDDAALEAIRQRRMQELMAKHGYQVGFSSTHGDARVFHVRPTKLQIDHEGACDMSTISRGHAPHLPLCSPREDGLHKSI